MTNMFISGTPLLESVGLLEPAVQELRERVRHMLRQAAIPLRAYAREYERHLELHNCDVQSFLRYSDCNLPAMGLFPLLATLMVGDGQLHYNHQGC